MKFSLAIGIALSLVVCISGGLLPAQQPVIFISRTDGSIIEVDRNGISAPITWSLNGLGGNLNWNAVGMECVASTQHLYITGGNADAIARTSSNGSNQFLLLNTANPTTYPGGTGPIRGRRLDCAIDETNGRLFFTNARDTVVFVGNLDGSTVADTLFAGFQETNGIEYNPVNDQVYFIAMFDNPTFAGGIYQGNADGTGTPTLLFPGTNFRHLTLDPVNGRIYWTDWLGGRIMGGNLNGTGSPTVIYAGLSNPYGIDLDIPSGNLFWTDISGNIFTGNVNGPFFLPLYFGLGNTRGVTLGTSFQNAPPVPTLSQWGLILLALLLTSIGTATLWQKRYQTT